MTAHEISTQLTRMGLSNYHVVGCKPIEGGVEIEEFHTERPYIMSYKKLVPQNRYFNGYGEE